MKKIALLISVLVSYNMTSFAQTPRTVRTKEKSAIHVPPQKVPESLKAIYSSFKSKTDLYNDTYGWAISLEESVAVPFTPKSDAHLSEVRVPVKYIAGDNQVNVSIYAGPGSVPLTLLVGPVTVTNMPGLSTCCTVSVADFSPLAVTAGTQYWVVVDTPISGTGSDFEGVWDAVAKIVPVAFNFQDNGWADVSGYDLPACEVLGTIP